MPQIDIGEWMPDQMALGNPGNVDVTNVIPLTPRSYGPVGTLSAATGALTARCQGAGSFRGIGGTIFNTAGDATKLYMLSSAAWSDITRTVGGAYSTQIDDMWCFTQFGDVIIAVNGTDNPQAYTIGSSTNYAVLAGSPPVARFCASVRDFVFLGRLANAKSTVEWSAINDPTGWTIGTNQCDDQLIPDGGQVMGIVGGEYATVFCEKTIQRFTYVGAPIIFQRDDISLERGTPCEGSIAAYQNTIFFVSYDGFWMLQGDGTSVPIGDQKVDRYFWNNVNNAFLYRVSATVDPLNKLYVISFPSTSSTDGSPDTIMIFNWTIGRWSKIIVGTEYLYPATTQQSYNIDNIDTLYGNLDAIPISLDSALLTGSGKRSLGAFDSTHKLGFFNGFNMAAVMETTEGAINPNGRALITEVWPEADGGTLSIQLGTRENANDNITWGSVVAQQSNGMCPVTSNSPYHRCRVYQAAAGVWSHTSGINITVRQAGRF